VPNQQHHYSILVQFVNDYFKSFVCSGMALREEELVNWRGVCSPVCGISG
jgi:hypothetical protein